MRCTNFQSYIPDDKNLKATVQRVVERMTALSDEETELLVRQSNKLLAQGFSEDVAVLTAYTATLTANERPA